MISQSTMEMMMMEQDFLTGSRYSDNKNDDDVMTALESVDEKLKECSKCIRYVYTTIIGDGG